MYATRPADRSPAFVPAVATAPDRRHVRRDEGNAEVGDFSPFFSLAK